MDYPTAIAIAVPASTFIVVLGTFVNRSHKNKMNAGVPRKELDALLKEKLDVSLCEERVKRIEGSFTALKEFIEQQFGWMRKKIDDLK